MFRTFTKVTAVITALLFSTGAYAQMSGTYTVDGVGGTGTTFATLAAAVTQLNTQGVSGATTIVMGVNETSPAGGYVITATGTAANTITFSGAGKTITAPSQASGILTDAFFKINGADYITIDNFVMTENSANTTVATATNNMTEFGIVIGRQNTTNGALNNTISNNTITLRGTTTYGNTIGVYMTGRHDVTNASYTTAGTASAATGANSNNIIRNNTISGVTQGVQILGDNTQNDVNNVIGGGATAGNTITIGPNTAVMPTTYSGAPTNLQGIAEAGNSNFTASYNTINTVGTTNNIVEDGVFFTSGMNVANSAININNNTVNLNQTSAASTTSAVYGVRNGGAGLATATLNINNNTITITSGTNGNGQLSWIYNTGTFGTVNIGGNNLSSSGIAGTGTAYLIYNSQASLTVNIQNNHTVGSIIRAATTGTFYCYYNVGSPASGTETISNNAFSNINISSTTSIFYGIYSATGNAFSKNINNNLISNIATGAITSGNALFAFYTTGLNATSQVQNNTVLNLSGNGGTLYGIYTTTTSIGGILSSNTISNITNAGANGYIVGITANSATNPVTFSGNTINGLTATGATSPIIRGIEVIAGANNIITQNTVSGISSTNSASSAALYGITVSGGTIANIIGNKVYGISAAGAGGLVKGINSNGGTTNNIQNNLIGDLQTPAATGNNAISGIEVTAGTNVNVAHNTVRIAASSTSTTTFGTSAFYVGSTTPAVTSVNNIFINNSTPGTTGGFTAAFRYSAAPTTAQYTNNSNNNLYYAGTPAANSVIYGESATATAANGQQTLAAFKAYTVTRDAASVTENTAFLSTTGTSPNYLHVDPATPSLAESGGTTSAGVSSDYDGDIRANYTGYAGTGSAPDLGADEFGGTNPNVCTGAPYTAAITSSIATTCASGTFTINITNSPYTPGLSYQLQSGPTGANTFANVGAAQNSLAFTLTGQAAATDYRVVVTCTNGGTTSISNIATVNQNNFLTCYCTPSGTCTNEYIKSVSVNTLTNSNAVCSTAGFGDYTGSVATITTTLNQGGTYPFSVLARINSSPSQVGVWIDYNQNGIFETTEFTLLGTGPTSGYSAVDYTFNSSITIPVTALTGQTRMRVRSNNANLANTAACGTGYSGETEDYLITIGAQTPCSGQPAVPTSASSVTATCPGIAFVLTASNYSPGQSGITFQWQSSPAGQNTFTSITGATSPTYTITSQTVATDYRFVVTCANGNLSSNSAVTNVAQTPAYSCICQPTISYTADEEILNVTVGSLSQSSTCSTTGTGPLSVLNRYSDYRTGSGAPAAPALTQGTSVPFSIQVGSCGTTTYSSGTAIFIDWNHNGVFTDAGEMVANNGTSTVAFPYSFTGNITVPATAALGLTAMRVINAESTAGASLLSCSTYGYGEIEDYLVNVTVNLACTGTPPATAATANSAGACPGGSFILNVTGIPVGTTGLTYQWQSSPTGQNNFTSITGATTLPYTVASQAAASDYRVIITCTASASSTTSSPVTVNVNPFYLCYCTPTGGNCTNEWVDGVTLNTLNNNNTGCSVGGYADYKSSTTATQTTSVNQGASYTITLKDHINAASSAIGVWIDYDHSGTFDASEYTLIGTGPATGFASLNQTFVGTISVPATALTGVTGMRVMAKNGAITATAACATAFFGEVEDYVITINAAVPCNGAPAQATAVSTVSSTCANAPFSVSISNLPTTSGNTFQWQSSPAGQNAFTNITGATAASYTVASQTVATDYQVVITCTASGLSTPSTIISIAQNNFMTCYCTPATTSSTYYINNFITTGASFSNISNTASGYSTGGYGQFPSQLLGVLQGDVINFTTAMISATASYGFSVFIDYNQNGSFADAGETVYTTTAYTVNPAGSFTIPASALTGATKMRIVANELSANPSTQYCSGVTYGEYEDYSINIAAPTPCNSAPPLSNATASITSACANSSFTLNVTGLPVGVGGFSYQWQSSPTNQNNFTNLGALQTTPSYTVTSQSVATDYQVIITCIAANQSTISNSVTVGQNAFTSCYCTPATTSATYYINNFTTTGAAVANISNTNSGYSTGGYGNFTATQTLDVIQGDAINFTTSTLPATSTFGFAVWIDYNHNGSFADAGETVFNTTTYISSPSGSFTIPANAPTGQTRMRIVASFTPSNPSALYCSGVTSGEYEDYTVNISTPTPCAGTPPATTATSTVSTTCAGTPFTLNVTGIPAGTIGLTYQWQSSAAGQNAFASIGTAQTTSAYTVANQNAATDYRVIVTCTNGNASTTSSTVSVSQAVFSTCYCIPASNCTNEYIKTVTLNTYTNNNGTCANTSTGYSDYTGLGSVVSFNQNTSYPVSVLAHINAANSPVGAWVDFNQNGVFEPSEYTLIGTGPATGTFPVDVTLSGSISVPLTATLGATRIRVRSNNNNGLTSAQACNNTGMYGEVEDYLVTITPPPVCSGVPTAGTATSSATAVCAGGTVNLTVAGFTSGVGGITIQWMSSTTTGGPYTNVTNGTGANTATYTTGALTANTYYVAQITCTSSGQTAQSNQVAVSVTNPQVTGTTPGTRCGPGSALLSATGSAGTGLFWYTAATGGSLLYNGPTFNTPSINATTTYYVQANQATSNFNVGQVSDASSNLSSNAGYGMYFSSANNVSINSVEIYPSTAGALNVTLKNASGVVVDTRTFVINASDISTTNTLTLPLNFIVPAGTVGYQLAYDLAINRGAGTYAYPATSNGFSITGNTIDGNNITSGTRYYFYNWSVSNVCVSGRTAVTATVTTPPAISVSASQSLICAGQSTTLTATSGNSGYTYTYTPGTLTGAVQTVTPATSTTYTVNAIDNSTGANSGCTTSATVAVSVGAAPPALTITPSSSAITCGGTPVTLNVNAAGNFVFGTGTTTNTLTAYPAPYTNYFGGAKHQMIIRASELMGAGLTAGMPITSVKFTVAAVGTTFSGSLQNFEIDMAHTTQTVASASAYITTGLTTVYGPLTQAIPTTGLPATVTHTFTTPFVWNGTDNIVIQTAYNNGNTGLSTDGVQMYQTDPGFVSTNYNYSDASTIALILSNPPVGAVNARPNMVLGSTTYPVAFSPMNGLYTDAAGTIAYTGGNVTKVYARPSTTVNYVGGASVGSCSSVANASVSVTGGGTALANGVGAADVYTYSQAGTTNINNADCELIATVSQSGAVPVNGYVTGKVTLDPSVQSYLSLPYATRHYDIEPQVNPSTSTANVKLYFTQAEMTAYNTYLNANNLLNTYTMMPTSSTDAVGMANLRVIQYHGTGTAPGNYTGTSIKITPTSVVWNSTNSWYEVNLPVTGFSGFYLTTGTLPTIAITAGLQGDMMNNGTMRNDFQGYFTPTTGLLPTTDPYTNTVTYNNINSTSGAAGTVVDWVVVEIRKAPSFGTSAISETRPLLLKPNGSIVNVDGTTPKFQPVAGTVRVVVRHRNHLAIMSNDITALGSDAVKTYNFTSALSQASTQPGDPVQMTQVGSKWCMWAGDVNQDLGIDGTDFGTVSSSTATGPFDVYDPTDLNLDGGVDGTDFGIMNFSNNTAPYSTLVNY